MEISSFVAGFLVGLVGGAISGLLGVTSGGILVPIVTMGLGVEQHVAQGISLIAQVPPTSLGGLRSYAGSGHDVPMRWVAWMAAAFVVGGCLGALLADRVSGEVLRWVYVVYLLILMAALVARRSRGAFEAEPGAGAPAGGETSMLLAIGATAGLSSGFLGIGGGLAVTALGTRLLGVSQHRAQALSLAISSLPLTAPSAAFYLAQGRSVPWPSIAAIVLGLFVGTLVGARGATRLDPARLKAIFVALLALMAAFMAYKALRP